MADSADQPKEELHVDSNEAEHGQQQQEEAGSDQKGGESGGEHSSHDVHPFPPQTTKTNDLPSPPPPLI